MSSEKSRRLGRGLEALIGPATTPRKDATRSTSDSRNDLRHLPVSAIHPNPFQPRRDFSDADLSELRSSLQTSGMLQPIVVRSVDGGFQLISGERRLRAATQLGWHEIPALVRDADERTMLTLALIENLQRTDLNAVEEARGYQRLHEEFQLTHQQISEAVGKERSTVSNVLRLLSLPKEVQTLLEQNRLTMGHARALLGLTKPRDVGRLAREVVAKGLSVREVERRVRRLAGNASGSTTRSAAVPDPAPATGTQHAVLRHLEDRLRRRLQTDVRVSVDSQGRGTLQLSFYSPDDLSRIVDAITGAPRIGD